MKKLLALLLLLAAPAQAQVLQSGGVTPGHIPYWVTDNYVQAHMYGTTTLVEGYWSSNVAGATNGFGSTAAGMNMWTVSSHPIRFGTNGHLALTFDTSTNPTATFTGNINAAGLATAGTIAGSICATSGGLILYESGATGCTISLEELKHDIVPMAGDRALSDVMGLRPIGYRFNEGDGRVRYGFGAHQVEGVNRTLSTYDGDGKLQAYDPNAILAATVMVVQQQQSTIQWMRLALGAGGLWLVGLTVVAVRRK